MRCGQGRGLDARLLRCQPRPRPKAKMSTERLDESEVQGSENDEASMFRRRLHSFERVCRVL